MDRRRGRRRRKNNSGGTGGNAGAGGGAVADTSVTLSTGSQLYSHATATGVGGAGTLRAGQQHWVFWWRSEQHYSLRQRNVRIRD